jgi:predicted transposase YbfD/YdcC
MSSLPANGANLREIIRAHWQIENNCHWVLDTTFREDANQTRAGNASKNLGTVRRIVLNLLSQDGTTIKSIPRKRRQALLNLSYRESILSLA